MIKSVSISMKLYVAALKPIDLNSQRQKVE